MVLFTVFCLLVGAGLAQRYKITVLVPTTAVMVGAAIVIAVLQSHTASWAILNIVAGGVSQQIGYFIGLRFHDLLEARHSETARSFKHRGSSGIQRVSGINPMK